MKQLYIVMIFVFTGYWIFVNAQDNSSVLSSQVIELKQNFPNPFNPSTQIEYFLPQRTYVEINIYNILGKKMFVLVKFEGAKGWHKVQFNAEDLPSGLYIYELLTPMFNLPAGRQGKPGKCCI